MTPYFARLADRAEGYVPAAVNSRASAPDPSWTEQTVEVVAPSASDDAVTTATADRNSTADGSADRSGITRFTKTLNATASQSANEQLDSTQSRALVSPSDEGVSATTASSSFASESSASGQVDARSGALATWMASNAIEENVTHSASKHEHQSTRVTATSKAGHPQSSADAQSSAPLQYAVASAQSASVTKRVVELAADDLMRDPSSLDAQTRPAKQAGRAATAEVFPNTASASRTTAADSASAISVAQAMEVAAISADTRTRRSAQSLEVHIGRVEVEVIAAPVRQPAPAPVFTPAAVATAAPSSSLPTFSAHRHYLRNG